ncbi:PAS domain S-box-containing protein/diguanylate cyclase (GGDEF)-like protein [Hydrogenispora ethanolica]|jgi:diguanylate cyclase (GGDEF)-like protein/PAS domain S-box-containing protein|uniref:PAS domain S-box-containing protein/diguanylate cyclase (GGDEF)-like protein n=1 Tax=Hydrogenispora ethanolica TaxID=1082276 RepID=A0A4R1SBN6_HYDET|nr:HD domain-containing phosphohydrolase [Hydrogenispora ethanolica]TCL76921.1 PAS domain S-box-containing protein/diguanylate cyclase (GGDEF)-like protein [Hydrogenispora ethanolica]
MQLDWLLPSLVTVTGLSALLLAANGLFGGWKERYFLDWTIGWSLSLGRLWVEAGLLFGPAPGAAGILCDSLLALAVFFFWRALWDLERGPEAGRRLLWLLPGAGILWSAVAHGSGYPWLGVVPVALAAARIQLGIGLHFIKLQTRYNYVTLRRLGGCLLFGGAQYLLEAGLRPLAAMPAWGYWVQSLAAFLTVAFILLLRVEKSCRERDESLANFREIFRNANDLLFLTSAGSDERILEVNELACQKLGRSREEFLRLRWPDLLAESCLGKAAEIRRELADRGRCTYEAAYRMEDGGELPVEVSQFALDGRALLLSSARDISERRRIEQALRELLFIDPITGLYNRTYLEEMLPALDRPAELPLGVILGDVNGLKLANDAFGHQAGDELLRRIAAILKACCRERDVIVRWGGDEFLLLLPQTGLEGLAQVCRAIRERCRTAPPDPIHLSLAMGFAVKQNPAQSLAECFRSADERMYQRKLQESKAVRNAMILSLQKSLAEKSNETEQHAERLRLLALQIGREVGLPAVLLDDLALLASLHDIGKIGIPDPILAKPGKLSPGEWQVMKRHPDIGYRILLSVPELAHLAKAVLAHHERWDGAGYPLGLKEDEIPLLARIIAIVDAYDAMTHKRIYKEADHPAYALAEIRRQAGSQFDPHLTEVFLKLMAATG